MRFSYGAALLALCAIVLQAHIASARIAEHEITSLPGFSGELPSRMYSGYISVGQGSRHIHYWFIESEGNPATDPVMLWMQGGPGSSGMLGLFTELGPFTLTDASFQVASDEPLTVFRNIYSWTKLGSVIFFESPAGVGFSYCDGGCKQFNDEYAAIDNFEFLYNFFSSYQEFASNPFYLTGESYGGIYVPMLANLLLEQDLINFKGVAVGNGCTGTSAEGGCGPDSPYWLVDIVHSLGQVSSATHKNLMEKCSDSLWDASKNPFSEECAYLSSTFLYEAGYYNPYNIFDECAGKNDLAAFKEFGKDKQLELSAVYDPRMKGLGWNIQPNGLNGYPCGRERGMNEWLSDKRVQEALHVQKYDSDFSYYWTMRDVRPIYRRLLDNGIRVLIYYGDTDTVVPVNGGEYWTTNMGFKVEEAYRPWTLDGGYQTAGHVVRYENNFTFLTIRGAGHMVPTYQPAAALAMMYYFLEDLDYPKSGTDFLPPLGSPLHTVPLKLSTLHSSSANRAKHLKYKELLAEKEALTKKVEELEKAIKKEKKTFFMRDF